MQVLVITNGIGKNFLPWHKNINLQNFNKILAKIWEIYIKYLGNTRGICNSDIYKVLAIAKMQKINNSQQILFRKSNIQFVRPDC